MDDERARELVIGERVRVQQLLAETEAAGREDRDAANAPGDLSDPAEPLTAQGVEDSLAEGLRARLAALDRAERRLAEGTFGRSILSGQPIPDSRLEADPAAELTVDEAQDG